MDLTGYIQSGAGEGVFFTSLTWVVNQFETFMGFRPFPGTLNVRIRDEDYPYIDKFFSKKDFELIPVDPQYCSASLKKVRVNGIEAAAVFPSEDIHIHGKDIIEVISHCNIKETLQLADGDRVTITEFSHDNPLKG